MTLEIYWGSGSSYSWRALLALEYKRLSYVSHFLHFSKLEHRSPEMLKLSPRGRVPVLKDDDVVFWEPLAILLYLDRKYPDPPLFGRTPAEAGAIMHYICEYQTHYESHLMKIVTAIFFQGVESHLEEMNKATNVIATEARNLDGRLTKSDWLVGDQCSAADLFVFPEVMLLLRALDRREAEDLRARILPIRANYPGIAAWVDRVRALPGYETTYPPHWRE
jgi:glutathione S-transferase